MADPQEWGFEPATGDGPQPSGAGRDVELRTAYEGMVQIRRLLTGGVCAPAPWELRRAPRAVALVLEAAGFPPSAVDADGRRSRTGYRVSAGTDGLVEVGWPGPPGSGAAREEQERLTACAAELERHGWDCLLYRGPRGRRYLEVRAPHPGG
ncbi:hypothetical protein ACIRBY_26270 [Streptomyces sp. NPDC096136]|uniref:hypothetical protein n=1 Tax=Streptomyces sp. NPDC096136 TaxID=3366076 RepID=UPI003811161E